MYTGSIQSQSFSDLYGNNREKFESNEKQELSEDQKQQVQELKKRDQEVKAHEAAHMAAGGSCVRGGASYSYQVGPDGKRYAVGGEVSIDVSAVSGDPQATIAKMQTVKRAALAPAQPSGQDRAVAAQAGAVEAEARKELLQQKSGSGEGKTSEKNIKVDSNRSGEINLKRKPATGNYSSNARIHSNQNGGEYLSVYA